MRKERRRVTLVNYVPTVPWYYRVHANYCPNGELIPGVFRDIEGGMSVDWEKYSTPTQTRNRAKEAEKNGIVSFVAGKVREIPQQVEHTPSDDSRAHSEIIGEETPKVRLKLMRIFRWEIIVGT
jgi:hypothetical protein